jgi:hypothetical protein
VPYRAMTGGSSGGSWDSYWVRVGALRCAEGLCAKHPERRVNIGTLRGQSLPCASMRSSR